MYLFVYIQFCYSFFGFDFIKCEVEMIINERVYYLYGGCCDFNLCNIYDLFNVLVIVDFLS